MLSFILYIWRGFTDQTIQYSVGVTAGIMFKVSSLSCTHDTAYFECNDKNWNVEENNNNYNFNVGTLKQMFTNKTKAK